jgi:hypothetical protein
MPVNDQGFFPLQCPQVTDHRFAVKIDSRGGSEKSGGSVESNAVFCPYCGYQADIDEFHTEDYRRRIDDVTRAIADRLADEAVEMITAPFRSSKWVTVRSSPRPSIRRLHTYTPDPTHRVMTCGSCGEEYSVYGIALYCVACGQLSPAEGFAEVLRVHRSIVTHLDSLPPDAKAQMEADGVFTKIHEDTVKDTFSALESFLGQVFRAHVTSADQVIRGRGNIFQRLNDASELYEAHLAVALSNLDSNAWAVLLEGSALRHLLTHQNGIVDERYLHAVPDGPFAIGQRIHVSREVSESILDAATTLADRLLAALP